MKRYQDTTSGNYTKSNWRVPTTTGPSQSGVFCGICGTKMYMNFRGEWRCPECMDGIMEGFAY